MRQKDSDLLKELLRKEAERREAHRVRVVRYRKRLKEGTVVKRPSKR